MEIDFDRFFRSAATINPFREKSEKVPKGDAESASEMVTFSQMSGYKRESDWLEKEIDRPVPTRPDVAEMIAGITRQTTLREVRDQRRKWVTDAEATLKAYRDGEDA